MDVGDPVVSGSAMTSIDTIAAWHELLQRRSADGLDALLADEVVFHSPIVHTPQVGKTLTTMYLTAALQVLANDSFVYVREIVGPRDAALEFQVEIDGISVNGIDLIRWNDLGRIVDFKVMVRPVKAVNLLHAQMRAMLESMT
jgi:hypothetical protein